MPLSYIRVADGCTRAYSQACKIHRGAARHTWSLSPCPFRSCSRGLWNARQPWDAHCDRRGCAKPGAQSCPIGCQPADIVADALHCIVPVALLLKNILVLSEQGLHLDMCRTG